MRKLLNRHSLIWMMVCWLQAGILIYSLAVHADNWRPLIDEVGPLGTYLVADIQLFIIIAALYGILSISTFLYFSFSVYHLWEWIRFPQSTCACGFGANHAEMFFACLFTASLYIIALQAERKLKSWQKVPAKSQSLRPPL